MSENFKRTYSYNYIFRTIIGKSNLCVIIYERILSYTKILSEVLFKSILSVADMSLKKIYRAVFAVDSNMCT